MFNFEWLSTPDGWIALLTLTFLEIVLGIDNIIFISILTNKLPEKIRPKARSAGIGLALLFRIIMLLGITWIIGFTEPLFAIFSYDVTGRDLILMLGGLFLLTKSTREIYHKTEVVESVEEDAKQTAAKNIIGIIVQIGLLDIVFSFDSILTAIGMTEEISIMILAVVISLVVMLIFAGKISSIIEKHPSLQMLALSFLILIGFVLITEGLPGDLSVHMPKGYIYFAVGFSLAVEFLNIRMQKARKKAKG